MLKLKGKLLRVIAPKMFYGQEINPKLQNIAEKYRRAMAQAFDVPEGWIRDEIVKKWALHLAMAFIQPEHWEEFLEKQGIE